MPDDRAFAESHARQMALLYYLVYRVRRIEQKVDALTDQHNALLRELTKGLKRKTQQLVTAVNKNS